MGRWRWALWRDRISASLVRSSTEYTAPEGLLGELMSTTRVLSVTAASRASRSREKSGVLQGTGLSTPSWFSA